MLTTYSAAIQGLDPAPVPHPQDRLLLRSLAALGKATTSSNVSFLRRTDYVSTADQSRSRYDTSSPKDPSRPKGDIKKRKRPDDGRDGDPARLLRAIAKGFNLAYPENVHRPVDGDGRVSESTPEEKLAWKAPRHPTNANLTLLDTYPVLPDLQAFPDSGNYLVMKFITNPVPASDSYDRRLDVGLLRPLELSAEYLAETEAQTAAYNADPTLPQPGPLQYDYEFFLPEDKQIVQPIQTMLNVDDARNQDTSLYNAENASAEKRFFRYERIRAYETHQQSADVENDFGDTVALALHDADGAQSGEQTAAYIYPVAQRTFIRPRRATQGAQLGSKLDEAKLDFLEVTIRDPDETEVAQRHSFQLRYENISTKS